MKLKVSSREDILTMIYVEKCKIDIAVPVNFRKSLSTDFPRSTTMAISIYRSCRRAE